MTPEEKFKQQYLGEFVPDGKEHNVCGQCTFFDNGCTTSEIEHKYGNSNTPACTEFKEKGTK